MPGAVEEAMLHEPLPIFLTIMAVILIAPIFSERVRLPGIIGLIIGGIIIGPYGLGLLGNGNIILLFATVGLIYLMFNAGLEIDLGQFNRVRSKAIVFGALTFLIPFIPTTILGRILGYEWPGAILFGSALTSHTLLAFPILTRLGIVRNETISVTVGATVLTDVSAFLVLALIAGIGSGDASPASLALLLVSIAIFAAVTLFGLPRIGKFFFQRFSGHDIEFQFVLVALFVTALLSELIGMHAVVGAFLAGLAINSALPRHSHVVHRVLFVGESIFIPAFLIYSGMITDPGAFVEGGDALTIGVAMTVLAYITKFIAAFVTARIYGYTRDEMMTMWGLSQCQAAVTLPTVLVGVELDLIPATVFSASMLMILATSVTSPLIVQRYGKRVSPPERTTTEGKLFERILIPVANPKTQEAMITLAGVLARSHNGKLMPIHVALAASGEVYGLSQQRLLMEAEVFRDENTDIVPLQRVDTSVARGILHAAIENDATMILLGWRGGKPTFAGSILGTVLDQVLWGAGIPVMVTRLTESINGLQRVLMVIAANSTAWDCLDEMAEAAITIADAVNAPLVVLADAGSMERIKDELARLDIEHPYEIRPLPANIVAELAPQVGPADLILLSTTGTRQRFQSSLGNLPEQLASQTDASLAVFHYPASR